MEQNGLNLFIYWFEFVDANAMKRPKKCWNKNKIHNSRDCASTKQYQTK